ncbi:helix-turn-helix domain-containing protein [Fontibacillus panacisegetis]
MLSIGKNTAYKLLEIGQIKHRRLGKKYLIPKAYVIEYLFGTVQ